MKEKYDLVVVIPIGPKASADAVADTLLSFIHYTSSSYKIIIADDSQIGVGNAVKEKIPAVEVLNREKNLGKGPGLYTNLGLAYQYALQTYDFTAVLKLDDDSLIIGKSPEKGALELFSNHPEIGMAGLHLKGRYFTDEFGTVTDNYWPRHKLIENTCSWKIIRNPVGNLTLRKIFIKAVWNGYELGENIQGGGYFMSYACLEKMDKTGNLPNPNLKKIDFEEDQLYSLLTVYAGFQLGDLQTGQDTCGVTWKGLTTSPETLREKGKKIIHSVRYWNDMQEDDIRSYFKQFRI